MATAYAGFDSFTPVAQPATYGRWVTGLAADDGDLDDVAHLMSLPIADADYAQFLGWRMIDIVSGGTYTFTSTISIRNAFLFTGPVIHQGASSALFLRSVDMRIDNAKTLLVGHSVTGVGKILVDGAGGGATSEIKAVNGADIKVDGAGGFMNVQNGATLSVDSTSEALFTNVPTISNTPAVGALSGANITKFVVVFATDGAGGFTAPLSGYNVASIAGGGSNIAARITFSRVMASASYSATASINTTTGTVKAYMPVFVTNTDWVDVSAFIDNTTPVVLTGGGHTTEIIRFRIEITDPGTTP